MAAVAILSFVVVSQMAGSHVRSAVSVKPPRDNTATIGRTNLGLPASLGQDPFVNGVSTSITNAASAVGFAIPQPNDPLASPSTLTNVWMDPVSGEVALYYASSQIEILVSTPPPDPASTYAATAKDFSAQGASVTTVHGVPALIIPEYAAAPSGVGTQSNPGSVTLTLGPAQAAVIGYRATSDLLRIAGTLA